MELLRSLSRTRPPRIPPYTSWGRPSSSTGQGARSGRDPVRVEPCSSLAASRPRNPGGPETPGIYALYQAASSSTWARAVNARSGCGAPDARAGLAEAQTRMGNRAAHNRARPASPAPAGAARAPKMNGGGNGAGFPAGGRRATCRENPDDPLGGMPMSPRSGGFKSLLKTRPAPPLTGSIVPRRKGLLSLIGLKQSGKLFPEPKPVRIPPKSE